VGLGDVAFAAGPALISLYLSFTSFDLLRPPTWVGAENYQRILTADAKFMASMRVTLFFVVFSVPLKLAFALAVAVALNRGIQGLPLYRAIFYLPSLIGTSVAIAVLWRQLFARDGLVNTLLWELFGINGPSWISHPDYSLWTLIILSIWQFGSPMIIFLAGLRQIPVDMYEAASLDGASKWRQFWKITLHLLQRRRPDHRGLQGLHPRVHHLRRHRRPGQLDALLHPLPLPGGLRLLPHGLRLGARLDPRRHHRRLHGALLPQLALLGALR
jgi:multiple sugar transport system permease protein